MTEVWYRTRPHTTDKNHLEGKKLTVLADLPPQKVKLKSGAEMNSLIVMDLENSACYKILVTDKDIDDLCTIVSKGKSFTFVIGEGKTWAEVGSFLK